MMVPYGRITYPSSRLPAFLAERDDQPNYPPSGDQVERGGHGAHLGMPHMQFAGTVSTTFAGTDPSVSKKLMEATAASTADTKRHPTWPILIIALGLLASLSWSGFLLWATGRTVGIW
jgi:hypothetical protein